MGLHLAATHPPPNLPLEGGGELPQGSLGQLRGPQESPKHLFDRGDQLFDLGCVWPQLLGQLLQIRIGDLDKSRLVDVGDHFDADRLQLGLGLMLELERLAWLRLVDLGRRYHDLLFLLGREALLKPLPMF